MFTTLTSLLFEAPIDVWVKRYGLENKSEVVPLVAEFQKFSASISDPDVTNYNFDQLKRIVEVVKLTKAHGLRSQTTKWLTKLVKELQSLTLNNIKEDYIPVLKTYEKNKEKIDKPLEEFKNITQLSQALQDVSSALKQPTNDKDKDIFFQQGGWELAMPHTTEASCELGSGTTWCTARTDSQNLFLNYVGKLEEDVTLFYVIKTGGNPRQDPWVKLSVGFINGKPVFDQGFGGVSVNAANGSLTQKKFFELLGEPLATNFLAQMKAKVRQQPVHPAKEEMKMIAGSVDMFTKKIESFRQQDYKVDFLDQLLKYPISDTRVFDMVVEMPRGILNVIDENLVRNPTITPEIIDKLVGKISGLTIADSPRVGPETLTKLTTHYGSNIGTIVASSILNNPKRPDQAVINLAKLLSTNGQDVFVDDIPMSPSLLAGLSTIQNTSIITLVAQHENTPPEALEKLVLQGKSGVIRNFAITNRSTPLRVVLPFVDSEYSPTRNAVSRRDDLPDDVMEKLSDDENTYTVQNIAAKINVPLTVLDRLSREETSDQVLESVVDNPRVTQEMLRNIISRKNELSGWIVGDAMARLRKPQTNHNEGRTNLSSLLF